MADCSELSMLLYQSARFHASKKGVDTVDKVVEEIQKSGIDVDREMFVNSLAEASAARAVDLTEAQKQIAKVMREASVDKKLTERLETLRVHLEQSTLPVSKRPEAAQYSDTRKTLQADIAAVKKALESSEPAVKAKLQKSIDVLAKRLLLNDFAAPVKVKSVPANREVRDLEDKLDKLRKQVQKKVRDAAPKKWYEHLANVTGVQKAIITTLDLVPMLRQGVLFTMGHPIKSTANFLESMKAIGNERTAREIQESINERDSAPEYKNVKLVQRDWDGNLENANEDFASKWLAPSGWKYDPRRVPAALSRGFTVYTNLVRADLYDSMKATVLRKGGGTQSDLETLAKVSNFATGDIPLGKLETATHALNLGFFSARYWASQIAAEVTPYVATAAEVAAPVMRLMGKDVKIMSSSAARQAVLTEYVRAGTGMLTFLFAAAMGSGEDKEGVYEEMLATIDPRSPYFLKPKIMGVRHDISGGLAKNTSLVAKSVLGQRLNKKGKVIPIRGDDAAFKEDDAFDLSMRTVRGKLAVLPSTYFDWTTGKTITGEDVTILGTVGNTVIPMSPRDIYDQAQAQGIDRPMSNLLSGFFTMVGAAPYIEQQRKGARAR
jgi:hypothetical protein